MSSSEGVQVDEADLAKYRGLLAEKVFDADGLAKNYRLTEADMAVVLAPPEKTLSAVDRRRVGRDR